MKAKALLEEFERGEALAREALSQAEVVAIIRKLKVLTMRYMKQNFRNDRWVTPIKPLPIKVDSGERWG